MKKETLLALATFITALANNEYGVSTETTGQDTPSTGGPEPEKKRRGRPPGTATPPADQQQQPPQQAESEPAKEPEKPAGLTPEQAEENYQKLRVIIEPHVKEGKGADVKKIIAKHCEAGTLKELANFPEKFAAFEKDIEALGY